MKKVLSIVLSIVMVLCMMPAMAFADTATYSDIAGTKCEAAVEELSELGVVTGYPDGTYKPEAVVTRAEMAKLIVTALGLNPTAGTTAFTDMDAAKWAIPYVGYAESLGIIEGYGNGLFGPNDTVTYDQAITMVVRALGYTEDCNEMKGQWPAVYVLKAKTLGLLEDISTGAAGATRGDVAILLGEAIDVQLVYADEEGRTVPRYDASDMRTLLANGADADYGTVTVSDVNGSTRNIREFLGAAGKIVKNEKGQVISVSDVKTTFLTGTFAADHSTFKTTDNVTYKVAATAVDGKDLVATTGKVTPGNIEIFTNAGASVATTSAVTGITTSGPVTIAVTLDGNSITGVYSAQIWNVNNAMKISQGELDQISINKTLLTNKFALDKNDEIDTKAFLLKGVDSLEDITKDNVVAVYATNGSIKKIEVGTEVVTGKITQEVGGKYTIDGKEYKVSTVTNSGFSVGSVLNPGYEVKLYLDYAGNIYHAMLVDGTAGNYAVVLSNNGVEPTTSSIYADTAKLQLFTANGELRLDVDAEALEDKSLLGSTYAAITGTGMYMTFVESEGKLVDFKAVSETGNATGTSINMQGMVKGYKIADDALIIAAPTTGAQFTGFVYSDVTKLSVISKADLLGKDIDRVSYVVDQGKVVFMVVADSAVASTAEYGIVTSKINLADGKYNANFYVNGTEYTAQPAKGTFSASTNGALYKINKDINGTYNFTSVTSSALVTSHTSKAAMDGEYVSVAAISTTTGGIAKNSTRLSIYDKAVVYVYDTAENAWTIGSQSNILSDDVDNVYYYATATKTTAENYGVVDFIVVVK